MLHSRFGFAVAMPVFVTLLLTALLFVLFPVLIYLDAAKIPVVVYGSLVFFAFIWYWMLFGMLRQYAIEAALDETGITVRPFLGWGKRTTYAFTDFDGYSVLVVPPWNRHREAIYLHRTGKMPVKLHGHYLKNYEELKAFVAMRVPSAREQTFSQWTEVKDAFRKG